MTETRHTGSAQVGAPQQRGQTPPEPTGWVGWLFFAGIMLILAGTFQAIAGLVAILNSGYYLVPASGLVVAVNYTAWGWVHLIFGVVVVLAGFGVMTGQFWARIVGVVLAAASAILHLAFLAASPVWFTIVIVLDVIVIYALTVHGKEMQNF